MAGRRAAGLSVWNPGADWLTQDASEPVLSYLPSSLWLIGVGNLGQAFAWLLTCLPYADRSKVELTPGLRSDRGLERQHVVAVVFAVGRSEEDPRRRALARGGCLTTTTLQSLMRRMTAVRAMSDRGLDVSRSGSVI
jgi:hypothetical protein